MTELGTIRHLEIKLGALLGLAGDYEGPSVWSNNELVEATLKSYLLVKRNHPLELDWDVAALVTLAKPLQTVAVSEEQFTVNELLLIQRYLKLSWDDGRTVLVYGVLPLEMLGKGPLAINDWLPKTALLSYAASIKILS